MKRVQAYVLEPKYKRANSLMALDTNKLPLPKDFDLQETSVIRLPAGEIAGNHTHSRQEAYFCLDEGVVLYWLDETGGMHTEKMADADKPQLFVIPPFVPHAVVNQSAYPATLLGYADGMLENVKSVEVATLATGDTEGLSEREATQTAHLLSKLKPGLLPHDVFHQVTRLAAMPIIEVVPLRLGAKGKVEILLLKREADDPVWPGQLHIPGTVIRATDAPGSFSAPLERVLTKELSGTKTSEPRFVKSILHHSGRGMEASQVYYVVVESEPTTGQFYDADDLPQSVVQSQLDFIPDAVACFRKRHSPKT